MINEREITNELGVIYEIKSKSIWDIAKDKIESFFLSTDTDILLDEKTKNIGLQIIDLFKKYNIIPNRVCSNGGELNVSFHRWNYEYDIEINNSDIMFIRDKKHCFYKKNSEGMVDCEFEIFECSIDSIDEHLSNIKNDTFEDLINLIKMFSDLPKNWHINYRKSKQFDKNMIKRGLDIVNFLGNRLIKPVGIFPIVTNMEGDVAIRICFYINKSYRIDIENHNNVLRIRDFFEYEDNIMSLTEEELPYIITKILLGKTLISNQELN